MNVPNQPQFSTRPKWILYRSACYLLGKGLHYGVGAEKLFHPRAVNAGKYCIGVDPRVGGAAEVCDSDLGVFAPKSFDWVLLDDVWREHPNPRQIFKQSIDLLKNGGHLLTVEELSKFGSHADGLLGEWSWVQKDIQVREGWELGVYKLVRGGKKGIHQREPVSKPRACIVRYGAFGDQVTITPLIRKLSEDGYHVTVNGQVTASEVLRHNPFVDNLVIQERDAIYNPELGEYWAEWEKEYDKYINLSESVEGSLLQVEGRLSYYTPAKWRREQVAGKNYYDETMRLGGYPEITGQCGELYFSKKEEKEVSQFLNQLRVGGARFIVLWSLKGSSHHKIWPLAHPTLHQWLQDKPDVCVLLVGGADAMGLRFEHPQVVDLVNKWPIRKVMLLTREVDLAVGPETGVMNAAGCFDTPKILFLSHSSPEQISKYWTNCVSMTPDPKVSPCYPCHQLHFSFESCPSAEIVDSNTNRQVAVVPSCTIAISQESVSGALTDAYKASRTN